MSGTAPADGAGPDGSGAATHATEERAGADPAPVPSRSPEELAARRRWRRREISRQVAPSIILAGILGSGLIMIPDSFGYRAACAGIAGACLTAAAVRLVLPRSWVGVMAVRGRVLDVAMYSAAGLSVVVAAFAVPLPGA